LSKKSNHKSKVKVLNAVAQVEASVHISVRTMVRHKSGPEAATQNAHAVADVLGDGPASTVLYLGSIVEEILNTDIVLALGGSNFISLMSRTEVHVVVKISRSSEAKATERLINVDFT